MDTISSRARRPFSSRSRLAWRDSSGSLVRDSPPEGPATKSARRWPGNMTRIPTRPSSRCQLRAGPQPRAARGRYVLRMAADESGAVAERKVSVIVACVMGGAAGAALGGHRGARAASGSAVAGAALLAASEAVARARQRPGEIPPLWQRIATSAALVAPLGWAAGRVIRAG